MKRIINLSTIILVLVLVISCKSGRVKDHNQTDLPKVAVVFPVTIDAFDQLKQGLTDAVGKKFEVKFFSAEGDPAKFETVIQSALLDKPQYLITIGTQITNTAFGAKFKNDLPIVIAGAISSPELVDALVNEGLEPPRKSQVAIVSDSPKESIYTLFNKAFQGFLPNAKTVGIIYNTAEINSKGTADKTCSILRQNNIVVMEGVINNSEDIEKVIDRLLLQGVEAIIIPHDKNAVTKATSIVKKCDEKKIPVFSLDDGTVKKDGVCVGVSVNYGTIGTLIGQTILKIENKETKAATLPIVSMENAMIYVNTKKLNDLGISQPENLEAFIEKIK